MNDAVNDARRVILSGLDTVKDMSEPVRNRLSAPLVGPPRFGSAREYRTWKASRAAQPKTWHPLHWPLGVWLLLGLVLILWVRSLIA
jgi:hypothetical protein